MHHLGVLMMLSRTLVLSAALLLVACGGDSDGDGLSNKEEKELGLNPDLEDTDGDGVDDADEIAAGTDALVADTDGDGLDDGDERSAGTDPLVADTDGDGLDDGAEIDANTDPLEGDSDNDGYLDGVEIAAGSDPNDSASLVYVGGWPFNADKDAISDPGLDGGRSAGDLLPRRQGADQFGDIVDLYDFANQGKPIIIDISAEWCGPCRDMAAWLDGDSTTYSQYNNVRRAVNDGEVIWITLLGQNVQGGQATGATAASWYGDFSNPNVPVIVDRGERLTNWADLQFFPSTMWVNPDMTIEVWRPNNSNRGLEALSEFLAAE